VCSLQTSLNAVLHKTLNVLARTHGIIKQADFLERMGFELRVDALTRAAPSCERKEAITNAAQRLVDRNGMGKEYQFLGVTASTNGSSTTDDGILWPFVKD
jgi:NADH dehydrogenase [ubiquinone] 1 alpha subcomplex assembly factor 7